MLISEWKFSVKSGRTFTLVYAKPSHTCRQLVEILCRGRFNSLQCISAHVTFAKESTESSFFLLKLVTRFGLRLHDFYLMIWKDKQTRLLYRRL